MCSPYYQASCLGTNNRYLENSLKGVSMYSDHQESKFSTQTVFTTNLSSLAVQMVVMFTQQKYRWTWSSSTISLKISPTPRDPPQLSHTSPPFLHAKPITYTFLTIRRNVILPVRADTCLCSHMGSSLSNDLWSSIFSP